MEKGLQQSENEMKTRKDETDVLVGMKVLIVEDNELNRDIVQEVLKERGLIVTEAADGQVAVDLFCGNPPGTFDVILMACQPRSRSARCSGPTQGRSRSWR